MEVYNRVPVRKAMLAEGNMYYTFEQHFALSSAVLVA